MREYASKCVASKCVASQLTACFFLIGGLNHHLYEVLVPLHSDYNLHHALAQCGTWHRLLLIHSILARCEELFSRKILRCDLHRMASKIGNFVSIIDPADETTPTTPTYKLLKMKLEHRLKI